MDSYLNNYNVINLGGSGWGLTQEIKRFYEFGQLYHPKVIILQFDETDPKDNFNYKLVEVEYVTPPHCSLDPKLV